MTRRLTLDLIAAARRLGLKGARIAHARSGPRLKGRWRGCAVALPLPRAAGTPLPDGCTLRRLKRALARAAAARPDPWAAQGNRANRRTPALPV